MLCANLLDTLYIYSWADIAEIAIISCGIYTFSHWLSYDSTNNLLPGFYAYCLLTIASYYASMYTLTVLLCISSPCLLVIFLLLHQQTLQKNYITLKNFSPKPEKIDWLTELMRGTITMINQNCEVLVLIERNDSLASFVTSSVPVYAPINHLLLNALSPSSTQNKHRMIWTNQKGILIGMQTDWTYSLDSLWTEEAIQELELWKQNALGVSSKTDAIFLHMNPKTHHNTIIVHGTSYERLHHETTMQLLNRYIFDTAASPKKGDSINVNTNPAKKSYTQRTR